MIGYPIMDSMPRAYKPLLPLWYLRAKLKLSLKYPSALEWRETTGRHKAGDMAGKWNGTGQYYVIRMNGDQFHAHRIVYYLRTGKDPGNMDVIHGDDNPEKDNRKLLFLFARKKPKAAKPRATRSDFNPNPNPQNGEGN
jgi:hypothetical protein